MATKQVIVIRRDLKMRRGKEIAQGAHGAMAFLTRRLVGDIILCNQVGEKVMVSPVEEVWLRSSFRKVCVCVNSEQELLDIETKAKAAGLECHLVTDNGTTEFGGVPTKTCLAIGPDEDAKIDPVTGHLKLY